MTGSFTFIHAADIHLDSPLAGLGQKNAAFSAAVRGATRQAFANIVDLAIAQQAAFVLIAGDLYDGRWRDQSTGQFAVAQLARLARAGIRAFIVFGNHDAESRITRHLSLPEGIHAFAHRQAEVIDLPEIGAAIHGRSYKDAATLDDIAATYSAPLADRFNIALLHTALEGHAGHAPYAPCTLSALQGAGHDYWALGHVHEAAIRAEFPHVVYPGNSQGRTVRECGAKGVMVVRVDHGQLVDIVHHPVDEVRWAQIAIEGGDAADSDSLLRLIAARLAEVAGSAEGRPTAVRISVRTSGAAGVAALADPAWFQSEVIGQAATVSDDLWVEAVRLLPMPAAGPASLPPELVAILAEAVSDPDCLKAVTAAIAPLVSKLPVEVGDTELTPLLAAARAENGEALLAAARTRVEASLNLGAG